MARMRVIHALTPRARNLWTEKMAALSGVQRILCPEQQIRRACSRLRQLLFRGVCIPVRAFCLPAISLTRTPGGRHMEWAAAFFDPCFERLEKAVYFVGLLCFCLVLIGITTVVGTFYAYIVPYLWQVQHPLLFSLYLLYGHYLLLNVCFHYFKGVYTDPGSAPKTAADADGTTKPEKLKRGWTFCKSCMSPKPPRAHHCRICDKCILKMDHHCPWMFNCVGHLNHRYFFSFVVFMWLGTSYVIHCAWARVFVLMNVTNPTIHSVIDTLWMGGSVSLARELPRSSRWESSLVLTVFFVCVGVTAALTILGGWHLYLVSFSETTIEFYTNKRDALRMKKEGQVFKNKYHYGCWNNWVVFFGLRNGRSFSRHVLLPSTHSPYHDGMDWEQDTAAVKDKLRTFPV